MTITGKNNIVVSGNNTNLYISPGAQSGGLVRYNSNMSQLEVYDGVSWLPLNNRYTIELSPYAEQIIEWAGKKMQEERRLDGLCEKYPSLERARNNFETILRLVQEEESV